MKRNYLPFVSTIVFFVCMTVLLLYLLAMRLYSPFPMAIFWVAVVTAIVNIVFQITRIPWRGHEGFLLAEILLLGIVLHMTYVIPVYGPQNTDAIRYMAVTKQILEHGVVLPIGPGPAAESTAAWPSLMIWTSQFHYITGIPLASIMKWVPSIFISSVSILLLYILIKKVFKSEKVPLFAMLLMVTVTYFVWEGAALETEIFSWVLMIAAIYFLAKAESGNRVACAGLFILCLAAVIFTHHLTSFLLLIFLVVSLATYRILGSFGSRLPFPLERSTLIITSTVALLAFVGIFSYWIYVYDTPLRALIEQGAALLHRQPGVLTAAEISHAIDPRTVMTVRGMILFWGYYFFYSVFAVVLLRGLFSRPKNRSPEFYSFVAFLSVLAIWGYVQLYVIPPKTPGTVGIERTVMLGWVWGFAPLVSCVLDSKRRLLKRVGIMILVAFMLFNIYSITPARWDFNAPGKLQSTVLREDYALAETLPLTAEEAGHRVMGAGYKASNMPILEHQGMQLYYLNALGLEQLERMNWIVVRKPEMRGYIEEYPLLVEKGATFEFKIDVLHRLEELLEGSSSGDRNRIYDSNNAVVFQ